MAAVTLVVVLLLPIPWLHVNSGFTPGTAWRLDGRLQIEGRSVDPPGRWTWLAVGRPQLIGEAIWDAVVGTDDPPTDLRRGLLTRSPALAEPAAAAVGLRAAGRDVPMGLIVEARNPIRDGLPERAVIASVDGIPLTERQAWEEWRAREAEVGASTTEAGTPTRHTLAFSLSDGRRFTVPGPGIPYQVINILDTAPADLEVGISFRLAELLPVDWFRNLSLGSSHGMMVALTTYADTVDGDLAQGRHIAGTGGIRGDGTVNRIGGLPSKARAAQRAGADVLIFPASQADELEGHDLGGMALVPVTTLSEAIEWLERPAT